MCFHLHFPIAVADKNSMQLILFGYLPLLFNKLQMFVNSAAEVLVRRNSHDGFC
jgi:hypothetical protein